MGNIVHYTCSFSENECYGQESEGRGGEGEQEGSEYIGEGGERKGKHRLIGILLDTIRLERGALESLQSRINQLFLSLVVQDLSSSTQSPGGL